jgi:hypothetical protein
MSVRSFSMVWLGFWLFELGVFFHTRALCLFCRVAVLLAGSVSAWLVDFGSAG